MKVEAAESIGVAQNGLKPSMCETLTGVWRVRVASQVEPLPKEDRSYCILTDGSQELTNRILVQVE